MKKEKMYLKPREDESSQQEGTMDIMGTNWEPWEELF